MSDITQAAPAPFVWGAGGSQMTPERIAAERKLADTLMQQGMDYSPVRHWTQGAARVAQAMLGGYDSRRADQAEQANMAADRDMIKGWFGGGTPAAAPVVAPATPAGDRAMALDASGQPVAGADGGIMPPAQPDYRNAIASIESAGQKNPYAAMGPVTSSGDRAHGRYQVMGTNIGPWSEAALGRRLTPEQFLADPAAQDQIFDHRFGTYVKQTGNPQDAASMWFSGKPMAGNTRTDQLGTSVPTYVQKFAKALGPSAAPADDPAALPPNATPTTGYAIPGQPAPTTAAPPGLNPSIIQALTSPYTSEGTKKVAQIMLQHQMGDKLTYQTLADGSILALDPMGRKPPQVVYTAPVKPQFSVVRKDAQGNDVHGFVDPLKRSVEEYSPTAATAVVPNGPDGKPFVRPPGADPNVPPIIGHDGKPLWMPSGGNYKKWTEEVSKNMADTASGKNTEVQAKSEKFANKMELAERNLGSMIDPGDGKPVTIDHYGRSLVGRGLEYVPGGNLMQPEKYQKYKQARDNFITALLRDESGAAISSSEFARYEKEMFPQPGDSASIVTQKREARRVAIEAMKKSAGPGYKSPTFDAPAGNKTASGITWSVE